MVDMGMGGSVISVSATHEEVHPGLGTENALLEVRDLRKEYVTGRGRLLLFDGLSFSVRRGEMLGSWALRERVKAHFCTFLVHLMRRRAVPYTSPQST